MRVHFEIPDVLWAQLVDVAEERGTSVAHLLSAAAGSLTHLDRGKQIRAAARRQRVLDLVREGRTDAEICLLTGELKNYVADNRRGAGLAANHGRKTA